MAKTEREDKGKGKGQNKLHTIANLVTGEARQITQRDWRERGKELRAEGWERVEAVEEDEVLAEV